MKNRKLESMADFGMFTLKNKPTNRSQKHAAMKEVRRIEAELLLTEIQFLEAIANVEYEDVAYDKIYGVFLEAFNTNMDIILRRVKPEYSVWNRDYFVELYRSVV